MARDFTLGVEEEFQIIDPETRELKSLISQLIESQTPLDEITLQPELHQSVVEVATGICESAQDVRREVVKNRLAAAKIAERVGVKIAAASTHPFSHWEDQPISTKERYVQSVEEMQDAARMNLIFGLHVHVGMPDKDMAIHIANSARYFLPHVFALSTNSPFWEGRLTGFKSFRTKVFDKFPRTGIPDYFDSHAAYENYVNLLIKTNCIDNAKKIWWDLRVHPFFGTVEFRICDVPLTAEETIAIAALFQCICAKLYKLRSRNLNFIIYPRALVNENKWRASRYGIDGRLIDFGKEEEVNTRVLIYELLDFVDDVADDLGCRHALVLVQKILEKGTGADRQLKVFEETKNLVSVADFIQSQFLGAL